MLKFIAGLMLGGAVGVVVMCLMFVAKEADRHIENAAPGLSDHTESELI